jgi:hypothetical protein
MAAAHDGELNRGAEVDGTSVNIANKTTAGSNRLGVVHIGVNPGVTVTSVDWGTDECTLGVAATAVDQFGQRAELWYRVNPTTSSVTVTVNFDGSAVGYAWASSYNGMDQVSPVRATANVVTVTAPGSPAIGSENVTQSVTSVAGDMVVDAISSFGVDMEQDASQTLVGWTRHGSTVGGGGSYELASGVSTAMSWDQGEDGPYGSQDTAIVMMSLKADAGGGGGSTIKSLALLGVG